MKAMKATTDGIRELVRQHLESQGYEMPTADELNPDEQCERVVALTYGILPMLAGKVAGQVLARALSYGDHCGWHTEVIDDTRTWLTRFEEGFAAGLAVPAPAWTFDRPAVIERFEAAAALMTKCLLAD